MRVTVGYLRRLVREAIAGSHPDESYDMELMDDPAMDASSMYVPDDIKDSIKKWAKSMGLAGKKRV